MHQKKYFYIFLHAILWLAYSLLPLTYALQRESSKVADVTKSAFTNPVFLVYVSLSSILLFYLNSEILIPQLFKKKKTIQYFTYSIIIILVLILLRVLLRIKITGNSYLTYYFYFNAFLPYIMIFAISASYRFFSDFQDEQKRLREKENERLKSELSFLRSQISPHFMFNLMNSLVALARKKSEILEPTLIKVSELLRYMLYEKDDSKISIEKELTYLRSYIELQRLRFGSHISIVFETKESNSHHGIEPMLLIPFVENAFKHGTGMVVEPTINIFLEANEKQLTFRVRNKINSENNESKDNSSGIGLANVKRRLDLLYPKNHSLIINSDSGFFDTELKILFE